MTGRYQAGCTNWHDMLVAAGGCDRWSCTDSVELYDPRLNTWRQIATLKTPRRGCSVAVVNGEDFFNLWLFPFFIDRHHLFSLLSTDQLYVIGGNDGVQSLTSVDILDLLNGTWRTGPELTIPRANVHAVATPDNVIYSVGGFNGKQFLCSMEILEPGEFLSSLLL